MAAPCGNPWRPIGGRFPRRVRWRVGPGVANALPRGRTTRPRLTSDVLNVPTGDGVHVFGTGAGLTLHGRSAGQAHSVTSVPGRPPAGVRRALDRRNLDA